MVNARTRSIVCFAIVSIIGLPTLVIGMKGWWYYPVFYDLKVAFAICLCAVTVLSVALLFLCGLSRCAAGFAIFFTAVWVLLLLPETQYFIDTREATENSIVKPFYRQHQLLGYVFVLLPVPFVLSGLWLRRRETI